MMRTAVLLALCYGAVVHGEGDLNGVAFSGANVETGNRPVQMLQCQLENLKDAGRVAIFASILLAILSAWSLIASLVMQKSIFPFHS